MNINAWFKAAAKGNLYVIKETALQWKGIQDANGDCAIHYAARANKLEVVKYLAPIELLAKNHRGQTPLDVAQDVGSANVVHFLQEAVKESSPIRMQFDSPAWFRAAEVGDLQTLSGGIARFKGYKSPMGDWKGHTALMIAATVGQVQVVQLLAKEEAQVSGPGGKTALMLACESNNLEIAKILAPLEAGLVDHYGWFALLYAIDSGCIGIVSTLYMHEGKMRNEFDLSGLEIAKQRGRHDVVEVIEELAQL